MNRATQIELMVDPCARKHGGNEQSREANKKNLKRREAQRMAVLEHITNAGTHGMSMKEVAKAMSTQFSSVSGRGTELKRLGMVEENGEVREGSAVLVATGTVRIPKPEPDKPKKELKPLSPSQARRELAELEWMYEHTAISTESYDSAKARIWLSIELWGVD